MFTDFMAFLVAAGLTPSQVISTSTMAFKDEKIQMFITSLKINRPLSVNNSSMLTDAMIFDILEHTAQLENPQFAGIFLTFETFQHSTS